MSGVDTLLDAAVRYSDAIPGIAARSAVATPSVIQSAAVEQLQVRGAGFGSVDSMSKSASHNQGVAQ